MGRHVAAVAARRHWHLKAWYLKPVLPDGLDQLQPSIILITVILITVNRAEVCSKA
jgi:hypothetical protein